MRSLPLTFLTASACAISLHGMDEIIQSVPPATLSEQSFCFPSVANSLASSLTRDGGYVLAGSFATTGAGGSGGLDIWMVKIDAQGNPEWDRFWGGALDETVAGIHQLPDGGYIIGGSSRSGNTGNKSSTNFGVVDYWVVKIDAQGNKEWDRSYGGSQTDLLAALQPTHDGGYILGGESWSLSGNEKSSPFFGLSDFWVVKIDALGNKQWERSFGGIDFDSLLTLQQTVDTGYILGGNSASGISGNKATGHFGEWDCWILKLDPQGNREWEKIFGGNDTDRLLTIRQTFDEGYIAGSQSLSGATGNKTSRGFGREDYWIIKMDAAGNKQWEQVFGGGAWDYLESIHPTADGGYIVAGSSWSAIAGNKTAPHFGESDYWVIRMDHQGTKKWERTFGGLDIDNLFSLHQKADGNYFLGGQSRSDRSGNKTSAPCRYHHFWTVLLQGDVVAPGPFRIESPNPVDKTALQFRFLFLEPGRRYTFQESDNLVIWQDVKSFVAVGEIHETTLMIEGAGQVFYRLKTP